MPPDTGTTSAPPRARRLAVPGGDRLAPLGVLAVLMGIATVVVVHAGRGGFFYQDEWAFILKRRGLGLETLLAPHGPHPVTSAVLAWKAMLQVFGLAHGYGPYKAMILAAHLLCAGATWLYARARIGAWAALSPAAVLLFLGPGWQDVLWPFQISFTGAVLTGLVALLALERGRRWDPLAAALLLVCAGCSLVAVGLLALAAFELARDGRPALRRAWVVLPGLALIAASRLGFRSDGPREVSLDAVPGALRWTTDSFATCLGVLTGLGATWGPALALAAVVGSTLLVRRGGVALGRVLALLGGAVTFWFVTGLGRDATSGSAVETSRYVYPGVALLLWAGASLAHGLRPGRRAGLALAAATAFACVSNVSGFRLGTDQLLPSARYLPVELTALEVARGHVADAFQPDVYRAPDITAKGYFDAIDAFGSPAPPVATLPGQAEDRLQAFDVSLVRALGLAGVAGPAPSATASAGALTAESVQGATARTVRGCVRLRPQAGPASVDVALAGPGTLRLRTVDAPATAVTVSLRRLAAGYGEGSTLTLPQSASVAVAIPRDRLATTPWHARIASAVPLTACLGA